MEEEEDVEGMEDDEDGCDAEGAVRVMSGLFLT